MKTNTNPTRDERQAALDAMLETLRSVLGMEFVVIEAAKDEADPNSEAVR